MKRNVSGFTIVELLIVIVVIAILAAISIVAYNGIQARARATQVVTGLEQAEKSLRLYSVAKGWSVWPSDGSLGLGANPTISKLVADLDGFDNYLQQAPEMPDPAWWNYDGDGDVKGECSGKNFGTNLVVTDLPRSIAELVDDQLDDGDIDCGDIRYRIGDSKLFYVLSDSDSL